MTNKIKLFIKVFLIVSGILFWIQAYYLMRFVVVPAYLSRDHWYVGYQWIVPVPSFNDKGEK